MHTELLTLDSLIKRSQYKLPYQAHPFLLRANSSFVINQPECKIVYTSFNEKNSGICTEFHILTRFINCFRHIASSIHDVLSHSVNEGHVNDLYTIIY